MIKKLLPTMIGAALVGGMAPAVADVTVFGHIDTSINYVDQSDDTTNLVCNTCSIGFKGRTVHNWTLLRASSSMTRTLKVFAVGIIPIRLFMACVVFRVWEFVISWSSTFPSYREKGTSCG